MSGRKIGGTGAARMDRAEVVVGSLMFDFDTATMAQVLRVPSEKFRDKVRQSLDDYMTTMRRELGEPPPREDVVAAYVATCAELLGRPIVPGELRADELALAEALDARFATREWLEEGGGLRRPGVKIHEGVRVGEGAYKAPGGLIRCIATVRDDRLDDVAFSGDFTALPASVPERARRRAGRLRARRGGAPRAGQRLLRTDQPGDPGRRPRRLGRGGPAGDHHHRCRREPGGRRKLDGPDIRSNDVRQPISMR